VGARKVPTRVKEKESIKEETAMETATTQPPQSTRQPIRIFILIHFIAQLSTALFGLPIHHHLLIQHATDDINTRHRPNNLHSQLI
jgi:hypothetical protein